MMRTLLAATLLTATAACGGAKQTGPVDNSGIGVDANAQGDAAANAADINAAALHSATPSTLNASDLVNSTSEVGGGAALDVAPAGNAN